MSEKTLELIKQKLNKANISFKHIHHETISRDSDGASKIRGTKQEEGAKALILQTKSKKFIQAIVPAHKRISLKKLKKIIHEKNVSLAHPNEVQELTECVVGSVPPFGILWDIDMYVDKTLLDLTEVVFSAGTLEDSIFIAPQELININQASIVDILSE